MSSPEFPGRFRVPSGRGEQEGAELQDGGAQKHTSLSASLK